MIFINDEDTAEILEVALRSVPAPPAAYDFGREVARVAYQRGFLAASACSDGAQARSLREVVYELFGERPNVAR